MTSKTAKAGRKNITPADDGVAPGATFLFWIISAVGVVLDLVSKSLAFSLVGNTPEKDVEVLPFFNLTLNYNEGIAFGMFSGQGLVLSIIAAIAIIVVIYLSMVWHERSRTACLGLAMILGGACGNLVDRLLYTSVRDFLNFHIGSRAWPTFNIADALICVGAGLLILQHFRKYKCGEDVVSPARESVSSRSNLKNG